jgi:hypothetical protein
MPTQPLSPLIEHFQSLEDPRCSYLVEHRLVSAWANAQRLVLAQVKVDEKSNEITAIPELLKVLDLQGCLVTIDAMGTQTAIAQQIIEGGGNYILSLKGIRATFMRMLSRCSPGRGSSSLRIFLKSFGCSPTEVRLPYTLAP